MYYVDIFILSLILLLLELGNYSSKTDLNEYSICVFNEQCKTLLFQTLQLAKLPVSSLADLGSTLSQGLETVASGIFHSSQMYQENRFILEQDPYETEL